MIRVNHGNFNGTTQEVLGNSGAGSNIVLFLFLDGVARRNLKNSGERGNSCFLEINLSKGLQKFDNAHPRRIIVDAIFGFTKEQHSNVNYVTILVTL